MLAWFSAGSGQYDLVVIGGGSGGLACAKEGMLISFLTTLLSKLAISLQQNFSSNVVNVSVAHYSNHGNYGLYLYC